MNRNPLARAILAASITAVLLAPGFLLSRGALSAPVPQALQPDDYLPLIFGKGLPSEILTATAEGAPFATATAEAASATATTVAATLTAAANTATTTATSTATTTATASPTIDPLATAYLHIVNLTDFPITFTLDGPTSENGEIPGQQSTTIRILLGHYKISLTRQCGFSKSEFDYTQPDATYELNVRCNT
jgi:hypothetical protein